MMLSGAAVVMWVLGTVVAAATSFFIGLWAREGLNDAEWESTYESGWTNGHAQGLHDANRGRFLRERAASSADAASGASNVA